jgi:hypothetical protein
MAKYKTLEDYNEFHREETRQKFNNIQARENNKNNNNRTNKKYMKYIFPDYSPELFLEAKTTLKYNL